MNINSVFGFFRRFGRPDPTHETGREGQSKTAQWWAGSIGMRGPQALAFDVRRLGARLPHSAGIFMLCATQDGGGWTPLLVGETQDLATRVPSHELMPEALLLSASHVHFLRCRLGRSERIALAGQIVHAYDPVLNQPGAKGFTQYIEAFGGPSGPHAITLETKIAPSAAQSA